MVTGTFSISNGPTYNFISEGQKVTVSAFANGSLQGSATLDSTTKTATLYSSSGVGDFTAVASLNIDSQTKTATLKYHVEYFGQQGTSSTDGILGSWSF
ncbi:hypothetical protein SAMN05660337_2938 [Maridesulfovibrio ferrireducens]|uniref:Uncharacterized protein n=1 Tax=Maridesulfovibrio ferrireducens TaxID=246191 RepID=A0A1G9JTK8_9BACT|nr:hypothetical protein [Maridesulfovibrio ferrireducens]SDL40555.1 hypothetical protein SAMN05660337_2938 [Maridesulfovibrio ferrireducens]